MIRLSDSRGGVDLPENYKSTRLIFQYADDGLVQNREAAGEQHDALDSDCVAESTAESELSFPYLGHSHLRAARISSWRCLESG